MLKLSLVVMFIGSLATLSFASSLMPMPAESRTPAIVALADGEAPLWVHTFE